jgi:ABC-type antimicrobial peptide transport system permease subunit
MPGDSTRWQRREVLCKPGRSLSLRFSELGVLGATTANVQLGVIGRTLRLTLLGIATGTIASLVVARAISALLFGTTPTDPVTFAAVIFTLAIVALLAGYLPARKASRIDPMVALRNN